MKICTICKIEKPYPEFNKKSSRKDGYSNECRPCTKARYKRYVESNPGVRERINKKASGYYHSNKEIIKEKNRKYRIENKEAIREKSRETKRNRYNEDLSWATQRRIRARVKMAIKRHGYTKRSSSAEMLGCDWTTLKNHFEKKFQAGMSWSNYGDWHIDHIIPLSLASTEEEMVSLCHYSNLQPLWAADNRAKSNKIIASYLEDTDNVPAAFRRYRL